MLGTKIADMQSIFDKDLALPEACMKAAWAMQAGFRDPGAKT
jgi:hypothetical protein